MLNLLVILLLVALLLSYGPGGVLGILIFVVLILALLGALTRL